MVSNINLITSLSRTGYGIAGLNILLQLERLGVTTHTFSPTGSFQGVYANTQAEAEIISKSVERAKLFAKDAPCVKIWHQFDLAQSCGSPYIGFPIFELDTFTEQEKHHLSYPDQLFVCSKWAKSVIESQVSGCNIKVVPLGINPEIFRNGAKEKQPNSPYIFFNCGKWEVRKGHDILVKMFNDAFTPDDDVELWLMPHNPFLSEHESKEWENYYKNSKLGDKIRILPEVKTHHELAQIMRQTDCGIFPARAEGWNLELLEMMALGKQVITTNYSAHTEFCYDGNAYLVNTPELELAYDGKWFFNQGNWAKIGKDQVDCFISFMRCCEDIRPKNSAGITTGQRFTWENSAKTICEYLGLGK